MPFWAVMRRRLRVVEAMLVLAGAALTLRLVPFRRIAARVGEVAPGAGTAAAEPSVDPAVDHVAAALASAVRRLRLRDCCLIMALAGEFMLRRRGVAAVLHLGVARSATGFEGHAWLEAGGRIVCGGRTARAFTPIARIVRAHRPA
jgi:hypothetical protein